MYNQIDKQMDRLYIPISPATESLSVFCYADK